MLRLPLYRPSLPRAVAIDPLLLDLCGDYEVAAVAARHFSGIDEPQAILTAEEYASVLTELETEVSARLLRGALSPLHDYRRY